MKLNTSLFICLFFSAIIAIKAADDQEYEIDSSENTNLLVDGEQDNQIEDDTQEPEAYVFQYQPSIRLEEMENNLPNGVMDYVDNGKVKEAMTNVFSEAMSTEVAKVGFADLQHEWKLMLEGPEASRVADTFGQNVHKVFTSVNGGNMINMLATTVHVLLSKAGEEKMCSGLNDIMSQTYSIFTSSEMPLIINKASGLVITAVNKNNAPLFVKQYWDEVEKLMDVKDLKVKLDKYFSNISSMMRSMSIIQQGNQKMQRTRSRRQ